MKVLSIKQPWAHLIAIGIKDIENRIWSTRIRGHIYIHASKCFDERALVWLTDERLARGLVLDRAILPVGAISGEVDIVDCAASSYLEWFTGHCGFVLANAVYYDKPILCKGSLRSFSLRTDE
jgi:hypothetical protein